MNADAYKYIRYNISQETRWATMEEIQRSCSYINLLDEDYPAAGLPIISDGKEAYVDNTDTHSLIFGATGSKKTRLFCMPMINMLAKAGESFIVTDPKGELYAQTSGLVEQKGYKTIVLNFRDIGKGDRWNPLSIPYELWHNGEKDEAGLLLADIASTIAAPIAKNAKDPFWPEAAQELAIAGLYVLMESAKKEEANMRSFAGISSYGSRDLIKDDLCDYMRKDSVAYINYNNTVCIRADVTASGIMSSLFGMLRAFCLNEKLSKMLSETTFDIKMFGREKTALYIILPDEKTTFHFLITMFIKQTYEVLIAEAQKEPERKLPIRVNFVLDEFCNIPAIPDMPAMISAARSRNMRYYLVVQSAHQLMSKYGEDADTIKGNCDNWVFLTSRELNLLNEISELCGNIVLPDGQQRKLISASELQRLDKAKGEALIMHARQYPIVSTLADISQYEMFGRYPTQKMREYDNHPLSCFTFERLIYDINHLQAIAPFATEEHKLSQAKKIYQEELDGQNVEDDTKSAQHPFAIRVSEYLRRHGKDVLENDETMSNKKDAEESEEERLKRQAEETQKEKERKEKIEIAKANAKARIAALLGEEYANRFFDENLNDVAVDLYDD